MNENIKKAILDMRAGKVADLDSLIGGALEEKGIIKVAELKKETASDFSKKKQKGQSNAPEEKEPKGDDEEENIANFGDKKAKPFTKADAKK